MLPQKQQMASSFLCFKAVACQKKFLLFDTPPLLFFLRARHWFSIACRLAGKVNEVGRQRHVVCALIPYLLPSWIFDVDIQHVMMTNLQYKKTLYSQSRTALNSIEKFVFFKGALDVARILFQHVQLLANLDKGIDALVQLFARVCGRELNADASLALRHYRIVEPGDVNALVEQFCRILL